MVDDDYYRTDNEGHSSDEEDAGEDDQEIQIDHCIKILIAIERDGIHYDVRNQKDDVLAAISEGRRGRGTILHELVKFDPKLHGIDRKRDRRDDRVKDGDNKKIAPPGSMKDVKEKYHALVKMVFELEPTILLTPDDKQETVLYTAVNLKKVGLLTLICDIGSADEYKSSLSKSIGMNPKTMMNCVHEAVSSKKFGNNAMKRRTVQALIENCDEATLAQQDPEGNTPLHIIMKHEYLSSFDMVEKVKPVVELMIEKCPEALIKPNKSGLTPFQFLTQICKKSFEEYKTVDKERKLEYMRQLEIEKRRIDNQNQIALARATQQILNTSQPPQQGIQKRTTIHSSSPTSPSLGKTSLEFGQTDRFMLSQAQDIIIAERAISSRAKDALYNDRSILDRPNLGRGTSRRPDPNSKTVRADVRREAATSTQPISRKTVSEKATRLSDDDLTFLYTIVENLIKRVVLQNFPLSEASTALYGRVPVTNRQLDFNLMGTTQPLSADMIKEYFSFLSFESILKFVALPMLKPDVVAPSQEPPSTSLISKRRRKTKAKTPDHYRKVFDWLRSNVQQILEIIVEDDLENPHSDEDIEDAIKDFGVEEWNWRKFDISSGTIIAAASDVRRLHLYTTGNDAVLQGWLASNGLRQLKKLEKVILHIKEPQSDRTKRNITEFKTNFTELMEQARYEKYIEADALSTIIDKLKEGRSNPNIKLDKLVPEIDKAAGRRRHADRSDRFVIVEEYLEPDVDESGKGQVRRFGPGDRGSVHKWLENVNKCRAWMNNTLPRDGVRRIKIALIDDGVDASHGKLKGNIYHGVSLGRASTTSHNVPSSYYASSSGHGTLMASLITFVCPWVEFYVAKMDDFNVRNGGAFTAKSAAQAVEWAAEHNVDIITMSWTIDDDDTIRDDLLALNDALSLAARKDILMFCAARDEGIESLSANKQPYPAASSTRNIFKIGAASPQGINSARVNLKAVDYLVPGTELHEFWQYADLPVMSSVDGSSSATALACGLAALVLVVLSRDRSGRWGNVGLNRGMGLGGGGSGGGGGGGALLFDRMKRIFDSVSQGDNTYLQVWNLWPDSLEERNVFDPERKAAMLQEFVNKLIEKSS